jgi:hypothetical protein
VSEAGVDTWRLGFKIGRRPPADHFEVAQYKAHWHPAFSLVTLEGHPLTGELCPGELLGDLHEQVLEAVEDVCGRAEPVGVMRLDSTATHTFATAADGFAVLRGIAAIVDGLPALKPAVFGKPPETVYLISKHGRGAKLGRAYDPFFRGLTARGEAVRMEAQDRFNGARKLQLEVALAAATPRARFHRRFVPVWRAGQDLTVAAFPKLAKRLAEKVEAGELSHTRARSIAGYLALDAAGATPSVPKRTRMWYRRLLREHNLAVADDSVFEPVTVDLGPVLEAALDSPLWGAEG